MMAKRKRPKQREDSTRWHVALLGGLGVGAFLVLVWAGAFLFLSRDSQAPDQARRQQAVDGAIASLPVKARVGALAPNFTLDDTNGTEVSLSDFQGKPVVLTFFHTW